MIKIFNLVILQLLCYFTFSQTCKENENFCKKCDVSNTLCYTCKYDILVPDLNGGCEGSLKCIDGKNFCNKCNKENSLCEECETGYLPDENGACSYINNCQLSYNGECFKCKDNYILIGKSNSFKICKYIYSADLKNCKSIDLSNGFCEVCEDGYFLSKKDKKCTATDNCYESNYGICLACNSGYYLNKKEEKCILQEKDFEHCKETTDGKNCYKCDNNYYLDQEGKCVSTNNCAKSENFKCIECLPNYYLTGNGEECSSEENCYEADRELGFCTWCKSGYYLKFSEKKCLLSDDDKDYKYCKTATDVCIECESGYYLGEDNKCTKTKSCSESNNGICIQCSEGKFLGSDNKCTNFEHCTYSNVHYDCIECEEGFFWYSINQTCGEWGENYIGCKQLDTNGIVCADCKDNFYLNKTDNKCYNNRDNNTNYYKCLMVIDNNCLQCSSNYYLGRDYKCSRIPNCQNSSNENSCNECEENYCLNLNKKTCEYSGKIYEEEDKKYFRCLKTNEDGTACAECQKGLFLNEKGLCINEEDCTEKEDDICTYCENKKNPWKGSCLNNIFGCIETTDENCYKCNDILDFNNCTECFEGYKINDKGKCILMN